MAKQREETWRLSEDLTMEILLRLPVKSLFRFRFVCKFWYNLIKSPNFIQLHLKHSSTRNNRILVFKWSYFGSFSPSDPLYEYLDLIRRGDIEVQIPKFRDYSIYFGGTCNGLLCISNLRDYTVLWNLAIREYKVLPPRPSWFSKGLPFLRMAIGFGFDSITNDYKVVTFLRCVDKDCESDESVESSEYYVSDESFEVDESYESSEHDESYESSEHDESYESYETDELDESFEDDRPVSSENRESDEACKVAKSNEPSKVDQSDGPCKVDQSPDSFENDESDKPCKVDQSPESSEHEEYSENDELDEFSELDRSPEYSEDDGSGEGIMRAEIYSLSTNSWTKIDLDHNLSRVDHNRDYVPLVNGALHWIAWKKGEGDNVEWKIILSFNVSNEKFGYIELPDDPLDKFGTPGKSLTVLNEYLALFVYYPCYATQFVDLWVMHEYTEAKSWTKQVSIGPVTGIQRPLLLWENETIILKKNWGLISCAIHTTEIISSETPSIDDILGFMIYHESLVSVS